MLDYEPRIKADELPERFRLHAEEWAQLDAEASRLEHMRKVVRAQIFLMHEGGVAEREAKAEADKAYVDHLTAMTEARTKANIARARKEALAHRIELFRTRSANVRAERQS